MEKRFRIRAGLFVIAFLLTLAVTQFASIPAYNPFDSPGCAGCEEVDGDIVSVGARETTGLALGSNELETNSVEHGFTNAVHNLVPELEFNVHQIERKVACARSDNGVGLPNEFAIDTALRLGLNSVRTLVEKDLHGHSTMRQGAKGTHAEICFRPDELLSGLPGFAALTPVPGTEEHAI